MPPAAESRIRELLHRGRAARDEWRRWRGRVRALRCLPALLRRLQRSEYWQVRFLCGEGRQSGLSNPATAAAAAASGRATSGSNNDASACQVRNTGPLGPVARRRPRRRLHGHSEPPWRHPVILRRRLHGERRADYDMHTAGARKQWKCGPSECWSSALAAAWLCRQRRRTAANSACSDSNPGRSTKKPDRRRRGCAVSRCSVRRPPPCYHPFPFPFSFPPLLRSASFPGSSRSRACVRKRK